MLFLQRLKVRRNCP
uniref:Uncharacterized protein n=1 Tax=Nymphaea colorata TaxID=210225 RepID=A0A5K0XKE9_9MAGN